jgi:Spy/CpxP family protein refolding chaperone
MTSGTRIKIWIVFVVVFALGCATGAAIDGVYRSRAAAGAGRTEEDRKRDAEEHFNKMRADLNLSDEQATKIRGVLEETRGEYRQLRNELRPRFDEPRLKARARIRELLNDEQRRKFDEITAQMDARRDEHEQQDRQR